VRNGGAVYGHLTANVESLHHLDVRARDAGGLSGRFVCVRNGGAVYEPDPVTKSEPAIPLGDARPDTAGDFLFEPGRGGGRIDKVRLAEPDFRWRYILASRFGEGQHLFPRRPHRSLCPRFTRRIGFCTIAPGHSRSNCPPCRYRRRWHSRWRERPQPLVAFQGGHYRLPADSMKCQSTIRFPPMARFTSGQAGSCWSMVPLSRRQAGAIVPTPRTMQGIIYHEYGHHITRHTADFRANNLCPSDQQNNRKTAMDEGHL